MFRTDPQHLAWVLENLAEGTVVNQIQVNDDDKQMAKKSLENMLSLF
jgi:quinolinate synthase